jgi:hypothetical protein
VSHVTPDESRAIRVDIGAPRVAGDTVTFVWEQSARNPHQPHNHWFLRYPGLDLTAFAPELLLEIFLALQFKVWSAHPGHIEIRLPFALPESTVAFWRDYHRATNLEVQPLGLDHLQDPWPGGASGFHPTYRHVVFFGGGKDSALAASLLAAIDGPESTLLLSAIAPLDTGKRALAGVHRRNVELILDPVSAATGLAGATFWSDYLANFRPGGDRPRPFLEFYHAATLPLLVAHGARFTTFGCPRNEYLAISRPGDRPYPHRWSGHPATIAAIGAHWARAYGLDLTPTSLCFPLNSIAEYAILASRFPAMYRSMVSCDSRDRPWCLGCSKCLRHGVATLAIDAPTPNVSIDAVLQSRHVDGILASIERHDPSYGRYVTDPTFSTNQNHLLDSISQFAMIQPMAIEGRLERASRTNLDHLRAHFAGELRPENLVAPRTAIAMLPPPLRAPIAALLAQEIEVVDDIPDRMLPDGTVWTAPWRVDPVLAPRVRQMVPAWISLPHSE